jgi:hypothetical protein
VTAREDAGSVPRFGRFKEAPSSTRTRSKERQVDEASSMAKAGVFSPGADGFPFGRRSRFDFRGGISKTATGTPWISRRSTTGWASRRSRAMFAVYRS